ncbi:non-ribosomal peptide synthetase/MFS transporter [Catenulispora rubra]|uniref:non-ribosomal peptide synthetase/MFS transporter n=1 Tax=Catenulispora rubra TaxID=280293 RepID=UPI002B26FFC5|nr:non-ribosomal peptide synthetase [Catenulispora rubra]
MSTTTPAAGLSADKRALLDQRLRRRANTAIGPRPEGAAPPLSFAQERLWFMDQFAPGTAAYHVTVAVDVDGPLDAGILERALAAVIGRHESLRMRFPVGDDGLPTVVVDADPVVSLPVHVPAAGEPGADGTGAADGNAASDEDAASDLARSLAGQPFDLAAGPLVRAFLVQRDVRSHILVLEAHHAVSDGWSSDLLVGEILDAYAALSAGAAWTPEPLPVQYGDYATWQRAQTATLARDVSYWRTQLADLPALELPLDRARPAVQTFVGGTFRFHIDGALTDRVSALGRDHGATLYMTLLAGFQAVLARYSGQRDFAVGTPVAGRSRPELEGLIGMFVNMLTMRFTAENDDDPSVMDLLDRTRRTVLDALAHQDVPFEQIVNELGVARDVSRPPLFQAVFALQNFQIRDHAPQRSDLPALSWMPLELPASRWDLELHAAESANGLWCEFIYNTALFDAATVERFSTHLITLLADAVERPGARISELGLLPAAERELTTTDWNDTDTPFPSEATLHGLISARCLANPTAVAVSFEGESLTWQELGERSGRLAGRLRELGVGAETLVAVCAERSLELVVGLLGVLRAGGAYLPLDPEYPAHRLAFMTEDAGASVVLTQRRLLGLVPDSGVQVIVLDDPEPAPTSASAVVASPDTQPDNAAYVIYTSGSTGKPKGVVNSHRGVVNRLDWMQRAFPLGPDDVVLQKTPAGFDVSVWEFFWPLITGARLVLAKPGGHKDAGYLRDLIVGAGVTTAHFVPSMLGVFLGQDGVQDCTSLRRVVCSGEELPHAAASEFLSRLPECELHNLYGPTEAAIDVSSWRCSPERLAGRTSVPIGAPIQNLRLYVLDAHGEPMPIGVPGELHIGGVGVARGYLNRPGLTADRFVPDPFGPPGSRLYRTGDSARWRPDGVIEFLGRLDHQVKLRGLRIELGEIEAALRARPGVRDAAVLVRTDVPGDQRLVGYVVGEADAADPADPAELRRALKETLPDYMVPSAFVTLDALPLSPNGKLDRAALPAPERGGTSQATYVEPREGLERDIASIWCAVLGVERVGAEDDFFELGGHSLSATQVVAKLRNLPSAQRQAGVMDLFAERTVRGLAALMARPQTDDGPRRLLHELTRRNRARPATATFLCVPYGGGSAAVYQPLADALPGDHALFALAIPGHDVGLDEDGLALDELADRCVKEALERVTGPVVVYGHCGVGSALAVEIALRLAAAGRAPEAVYIGAMFPFAKPKGPLGLVGRMEGRFGANRNHASWLRSMGVDMDDVEPEQADRIIRNMRRDGTAAQEYFTGLLDSAVEKLAAPVISVVGSADPVTEYHRERYREWGFLSDTMALAVLDEAGHFFLKYRAGELAAIVTSAHVEIAGRGGAEADSVAAEPLPPGTAGAASSSNPATANPATVLEVHHDTGPDSADRAAAPSVRRFLAVAAGQLVSLTGSALTGWAIPIYVYLATGSIGRMAALSILALVPNLLVGPIAGAVVDRTDRRRLMLIFSAASASGELILSTLLWSHHLAVWHLYVLVVWLSVSSAFQRLSYLSAIPQLVPKRFLGHANGVAQLTNGFAALVVPMLAAGLMAAIHLSGILVIDMVSYAAALSVLALVRFPATLGAHRREPLLTEVRHGLSYSWGNKKLRSMLLFSAVLNIFLAPVFILVVPLVLAFGSLTQVGVVSLLEALGAVGGAALITVWGGPRRRRMAGAMLATLVLSVFFLVTGLHPSVLVIGLGVFGTAFCLEVIQAIYTTIVQVTVPQRYHGRVFSLNMMIAWSTLPLGWILAPAVADRFESLMAPHGTLASSLGTILGTGKGRGIGLMFVAMALAVLVATLIAMRLRVFAHFDEDAAEPVPDDLVGLRERERRAAEAAVEAVAEGAVAEGEFAGSAR